MKTKFVQLESDAFLTDIDFLNMTAEQRGVYCTLILYMYCNDGRCEFDPQSLARVCNCEDFDAVWQTIRKKFIRSKKYIRHKRVTAELRRVQERRQAKREAGLRGADARWHSHDGPDGTASETVMAKGREGNETKRNRKRTEGKSRKVRQRNSAGGPAAAEESAHGRQAETVTEFEDRDLADESDRCDHDTTTGLHSDSPASTSRSDHECCDHVESATEETAAVPESDISADAALSQGNLWGQSIRFNDTLSMILKPRNQSDRTSFRRIATWLVRQIEQGRFNRDIFKRVLDYAAEAAGGKSRNPAAVFTAILKSELDYRP